VLTTYDTEDDVTRALQAGASGYLLKGANRTTLRDAIRWCTPAAATSHRRSPTG
jgi:DNA-binding NarL/FixJ family response regulator